MHCLPEYSVQAHLLVLLCLIWRQVQSPAYLLQRALAPHMVPCVQVLPAVTDNGRPLPVR